MLHTFKHSGGKDNVFFLGGYTVCIFMYICVYLYVCFFFLSLFQFVRLFNCFSCIFFFLFFRKPTQLHSSGAYLFLPSFVCLYCFICLKLQSVSFGTLAFNTQNCVHLAEEHCSRSYFSLFMSMTNHAGTGLLHSGTYPNQSKIVRI